MNVRAVFACLMVFLAMPILAQDVQRLKSATVVLTDDPELRASVETRLVTVARANNYDAVTSFDFAPNVDDINNRDFVAALEREGIQTVLMLRPAAIGEDSSLESVRASLAPETFDVMREFAGQVSRVDPDHLIAVVHMAIYTIRDGRAELLSAGAVWLDEEVESQDEGIDRLIDLVLYNVDAVRPALRRRLGLPPLE